MRAFRLSIILASLCILATPAPGSGLAVPRPNFLVVVVDDAGLTDLGAYGSEIRTPTIDRLAARGVRFTNFHASPMCAPSRAMLLTGVDSHTAGVGSLYEATPLRHRDRPGYEGHLRDDVVTVATRLKSVGYRTYLTGKWNLGHTPDTLPSARGFDRTFALDATGADNYEKRPYLPLYDDVPWFADGEPTDLPEDFYSSEFLVDKMIELLAEGRVSETDAPFFAYLAFQAVHIPLQAPREFIERYEGTYDRGWQWLRAERHRRAVEAGVVPTEAPPASAPPQRDWDSLPPEERALWSKSMAVQAGMLEAMDHHLGRLVAHLEQTGELERTVVLVLSDNGPEAGDPFATPGFARWAESMGYRRDFETLGEKDSYVVIGPDFAAATAAPLAYYKFHGGEGGMRVPLVIAGPGVSPSGSSRPASSASGDGVRQGSRPGRGASTAAFAFITDVAPTILELAAVDEPAPPSGRPMVGRSLVPVLRDSSRRVHPDDETVAFETAGHAGVFQGGHKLVRVGAPAGDGEWRLYDLRTDPGETLDLSTSQPARFAELMSHYEAWAERVGVLEVPASYSPTTQLTLNLIHGRLRRHLPLLVAALTTALVAILWIARRRRATRLGEPFGAKNGGSV